MLGRSGDDVNDGEDTGDEHSEAIEEVLDKKAAVSDLNELDYNLDLDEQLQYIRTGRVAAGTIDGVDIVLKLAPARENDELRWEVKSTMRRVISAEYDDRLEKAMAASSIEDVSTHTVDSMVEAFKIFEDTVEEYGLEEVTNPDEDFPESDEK